MLELERSVTHYHLLRQSRVRFFGLRPDSPSSTIFHSFPCVISCRRRARGPWLLAGSGTERHGREYQGDGMYQLDVNDVDIDSDEIESIAFGRLSLDLDTIQVHRHVSLGVVTVRRWVDGCAFSSLAQVDGRQYAHVVYSHYTYSCPNMSQKNPNASYAKLRLFVGPPPTVLSLSSRAFIPSVQRTCANVSWRHV